MYCIRNKIQKFTARIKQFILQSVEKVWMDIVGQHANEI